MEYENREQVIESLKSGNKDFKRCDLRGLDLSGLVAFGVDFRGAKLTGASFIGADLAGASFADAKLTGANFTRASFTDGKLIGADFTDADLTDAELAAVELWNCVGDGKRIKNIYGFRWKITYTKDFLQIGCQGHLIDEWAGFSRKVIFQMDFFAPEFWRDQKVKIFDHIKNNPAE